MERTLLSLLIDATMGAMVFPTFDKFITEFEKGFKATNQVRDASHQIAVLRQGKKTAEQIIMEFRLLTNQAGYMIATASDHLHLIKKLQTVLNPSLVRKVLLSPGVPTTIDEWAERAIQIDTMYRQTNEIMEQLLGDKSLQKTRLPPPLRFQ